MTDKNGSFGAFVSGFVIGGLVGAAVALLFAPQSGEETRTLIYDKGIELKDQAEEFVDDTRTRAEKLAKEAKAKAEDLQKRGQELLDDQKKKITKAVDSGKEAVKKNKTDTAKK